MIAELASLAQHIQVSDFQREFLDVRWLGQLRWMDRRARSNRNYHYALRLITIVGSVSIPALVGLNLSVEMNQAIFAVSLAVALSAGLDEFFRFGERWRHYRSTTERLQTEGWRFLQLSDSYATFANHSQACTLFSERVEAILEEDTDGYFQRAVPQQHTRKRQKKPLMPG
ncbi:MAG: DUF4231 domain-containing protein [Chloroflexi bacterium]|nr:DUF4231 domain-containing protein [Chloroflexota bacterium]